MLSDEEYQQLQMALVKRLDTGNVIRGGGSLRKMRWGAKGRGKRGGSRVIYYWAVNQEQLLLLLIYPKNVRDDLSQNQVNVLRRIVEAEYP